jgi:uncharacterized protein HemX
METTLLKDWLYVGTAVIAIGSAVYTWLTSRSKVNTEHLAAVDRTLADHGARIATVEQEVRHLPAKDDVHELKLALAKLDGTVGRLDESLGAVKRSVDRMDTYLRRE